jgi:hypothetical protein
VGGTLFLAKVFAVVSDVCGFPEFFRHSTATSHNVFFVEFLKFILAIFSFSTSVFFRNEIGKYDCYICGISLLSPSLSVNFAGFVFVVYQNN